MLMYMDAPLLIMGLQLEELWVEKLVSVVTERSNPALRECAGEGRILYERFVK